MQSAGEFDLVLRNGLLVDGTGGPAVKADIGIRGERLAAVGELGNAEARAEIDVSGLTIAPGFIDVHTHDDAALIARPDMAPKLTQGVTTVIGGNCGISAAPYGAAGDPPDLLRLIFKSDRFVAATFERYVEKVEQAVPAVNAAFLTGHTTLRMEVMGTDLARPATAEEVSRMQALLRQCLEQGSLGLSTGLFYPPARGAPTEEVIEVARPLREYAGIYTTHMRDEGDRVLESMEEAARIGRAVGAPVVVSHHKCMGRRNFGRSTATLAFLQQARQHQPIALDVYPYTACSTILNAEMVEQSIKTLLTWCDPYPQFSAVDLREAARVLNCSIAEAIPRLQPAGAVYFMMEEDDVTRILCSSGAMIGSDGLPEDQHPHPRLWGTFPRVLGRYVRERGVLSLEEAIHRMTGLSARTFGIADRGQVAPGMYADLCVFDADKIVDAATFEVPACPALGIHYVFVNGRLALQKGKPTGIRAGRVLRRVAAGASDRNDPSSG